MIVIKGKGVCGGVAFGKLELLIKDTNPVMRIRVDDPQKEVKRFEYAVDRALSQLKRLYEKAVAEVGEENAMIFEIHKMMLEDRDYLDSVISNITTQKLNAESAVAITSDSFAEMFSAMEDSYMQARAADVRDISERVIDLLTEKEQRTEKNETSVIAAVDLAPSETVQMDKSKILAFVTEKGSGNSFP